MDSGSWFAIWAICLRTSFFVMMPRSLLEKKQNKEKRSALQYRLMPVPRHQCLFHLGTRRVISQLPLQLGVANWVSSGHWGVGEGERCPSQVTGTSLHTLSLLLCQTEAEEPVKVTGDWLRSHQILIPGCLNDCVVQSPRLLQPILDVTWEKNKPLSCQATGIASLFITAVNLQWTTHTPKF